MIDILTYKPPITGASGTTKTHQRQPGRRPSSRTAMAIKAGGRFAEVSRMVSWVSVCFAGLGRTTANQTYLQFLSPTLGRYC